MFYYFGRRIPFIERYVNSAAITCNNHHVLNGILFYRWELKKRFSKQDLVYLQELRNSLAHSDVVSFANKRFRSSRLKETFNTYFEQDAEKTRNLKEKYEELSLEYALSQLFSPKQKELFKKKLKGEPLNKTEKEYYSRTVKKKVSALANPEPHRLAQKLLEY